MMTLFKARLLTDSQPLLQGVALDRQPALKRLLSRSLCHSLLCLLMRLLLLTWLTRKSLCLLQDSFVESMEPDFSDEPKKGGDAIEATLSAEAELAQALPPRSRSEIDLLPGNKSAFAWSDDPLPDKEVLVDSEASDSLMSFVRKKSLLVHNPDGGDSDSAAQPLPRNASRDRTPLHSCLAQSASRPRSKTRGRDATRSRSRASPERRLEDGKVKPSGFISGQVASKPLPPTSEDLGSPASRADFLRWTALSLQRDWKPFSRCWCNLHLCLYMFCPSWKYSVAHPRSLAACVLSSDESLGGCLVLLGLLCAHNRKGRRSSEDCLALAQLFLVPLVQQALQRHPQSLDYHCVGVGHVP